MPARLAPLTALLLFLAACNGQAANERARQAAEKIRESLADLDESALSQDVSPATVRRVQEWLRTVNEYQGAVTGELDSVTLNAIEAFQRSAGLRDDGFLDEATLAALRAAAEKLSASDPAA